jgi:hypothetical protein
MVLATSEYQRDHYRTCEPGLCCVCGMCASPAVERTHTHTHTHTHTPSLHPSTASEIHQQTHSSPSPSRPLLQTTGSAQHRDTLQGSWGWGCIMPPLTARRHLYLVYVCGPGHPILSPSVCYPEKKSINPKPSTSAAVFSTGPVPSLVHRDPLGVWSDCP